jgi:effector-binding domain-containing protein
MAVAAGLPPPEPGKGENGMFVRLGRRRGARAAAVALMASFLAAGAQFAAAQPAQPPAAAQPGGGAGTPAPIAPEGLATKPGDPFGEEVTLTAKPIVFVKGSGTWDQAFPIISSALKTVEAYVAKAGLKADGQPMTIFTATDDKGFDYQAAVPLAEPPKEPPGGGIESGRSPDGRALKFVHRGSYDSLDDTYEAITNYLYAKHLESRNILIEQYVTDPTSTDEKNLVVDVLVLVK